jgi:hypothetical protein
MTYTCHTYTSETIYPTRYLLPPIVWTVLTVADVLLLVEAVVELLMFPATGLIAEESISRRRRSVLVSPSEEELPPLDALDRLSFMLENRSPDLPAGLAVVLVPLSADRTSEISVADEDNTLGYTIPPVRSGALVLAAGGQVAASGGALDSPCVETTRPSRSKRTRDDMAVFRTGATGSGTGAGAGALAAAAATAVLL